MSFVFTFIHCVMKEKGKITGVLRLNSWIIEPGSFYYRVFTNSPQYKNANIANFVLVAIRQKLDQ